MSQHELAAKMRTSAATVSRIESGDRDWGKGYLEAFSHIIGCPNVTDPITRPPELAVTLEDRLKQAPPEIRDAIETLLNSIKLKLTSRPDPSLPEP